MQKTLTFLFLVSFLCLASIPVDTRATSDSVARAKAASDSAASAAQKDGMATVEDEEINETVDRLSSKADDWREPSKYSEEQYVHAIQQWLDDMSPAQRDRARKILREARPGLTVLRKAIREKKYELANLSFDRHTSPEALPRLGQELQALRRILRSKLNDVSKRLENEAGVPMGPLGGDGFWLVPKTIEPASLNNVLHSPAVSQLGPVLQGETRGTEPCLA